MNLESIQTSTTPDLSLISTLSHTFVEIDYELISTPILLPSADLFKKGCCQLQAKVCAQFVQYLELVNCVFKFAHEKKCG